MQTIRRSTDIMRVKRKYGRLVTTAVLLSSLSIHTPASELATRGRKEVEIGGTRFLFVKHEVKDMPGSLLLGLRDVSSQTNGLPPTIELLSCQNATVASTDADVWVSPNSRSICLLFGRTIGGSIADFYLFMFKIDSQSLAVRRYNGQIKKTVMIVEGEEVEIERHLPLSVKQVLTSRLDPRSPIYDKLFPPTRMRTISNVRLNDTPQGACELTGVLNGQFLFRLSLHIQEDEESVSVSEARVESYHPEKE